METNAVDTTCIAATNNCPRCGCGEFIDRKLKRYCQKCGQLCETCCDGGNINAG